MNNTKLEFEFEQNTKIKRLIPIILSVLLAAIMVGGAELFGEKEIIFPEITAIAIGALVAPVQSWNTSRLRLLAAITSSALFGVLIVRLPLPLIVKIIAGLVISVCIITISKTGFVPAISACILPILMSTKSLVYVLSVIVMTGLILISQAFLEKLDFREKYDFHPVAPNKNLLILRLKQIAVLSIISILPAYFHEIFFIAPPLMVGFVEMSSPRSKLRKRAPQAVLLIISAAVIGVLSRHFIAEIAGLPLFAAAAVSVLGIILLVAKLKLYFPPCGAIATLPFIIPQNALVRFPFEVAAGFIIMTILAMTIFKDDN